MDDLKNTYKSDYEARYNYYKNEIKKLNKNKSLKKTQKSQNNIKIDSFISTPPLSDTDTLLNQLLENKKSNYNNEKKQNNNKNENFGFFKNFQNEKIFENGNFTKNGKYFLRCEICYHKNNECICYLLNEEKKEKLFLRKISSFDNKKKEKKKKRFILKRVYYL